MLLVWPADRTLDVTEQTRLGLFLDAFAGDPTTNLYKRLIDSKTRDTDLGAQSVFGSLSEDQGFPVAIGFGDVPVAKMNERDLYGSARARVVAELTRVSALPAMPPSCASSTTGCAAAFFPAGAICRNSSTPLRASASGQRRGMDDASLQAEQERRVSPIAHDEERARRDRAHRSRPTGNPWTQDLITVEADRSAERCSLDRRRQAQSRISCERIRNSAPRASRRSSPD